MSSGSRPDHVRINSGSRPDHVRITDQLRITSENQPMETPRPGVGARPPRSFACGGGDNLADESAEVLEAADVADTAGMTAEACAAATAAAVTEAPWPVIGSGSAPISEVDFRELYYSQAGGYQQAWQTLGAPDWLGRLRRRRLIAGRDVGALVGRNTYVGLSEAAVRTELPTLMVALARGGAG